METGAGRARRFAVGRPSDIPVGSRRIVDIPGVGSVGIFNVKGEYYAIKNVCPHQGGPLCLGKVTGTTQAAFTPGEPPKLKWVREGEILRCPWHAWEFDIKVGKAIFSDKKRVATYEVSVASRAEPEVERVYVPPPAETYPVTVEEQTLILELPDRSRSSLRQ